MFLQHFICITQSLPRKPRSILGELLGDSDLINKLNENMQLVVKRQDENFARIQKLDNSIIGHVNDLLRNEVTNDENIRKLYHLMKAMGQFIDNTNKRSVFFYLRLHQVKFIQNELDAIETEINLLKDSLHH